MRNYLLAAVLVAISLIAASLLAPHTQIAEGSATMGTVSAHALHLSIDIHGLPVMRMHDYSVELDH
jgi:hypothetical protein